MLDELSGSRFWGVVVSVIDKAREHFYVQSCASKDASYVEKILRSIHPEYQEVVVTAVERPSYLSRCYGDPE